MDSALTLEERIQSVLTRIDDACASSGRKREEVTLVAVSKTKPASLIRDAWDAGLSLFGESYVQEWREKSEELSDCTERGLVWHFIGHLQRNKCRNIAGEVDLIHGVGSFSLAKEIDKRTPDGVTQPILLQFNLGKEDSKKGFLKAEDVMPILMPEEPWQHLEIQGLMTMPPPSEDPEEARPYFRELFNIREELRKETGLPLPHLSMGMSGDLEVAIAEGATFIRVGSDLFGPRNY